VRKIYARCLESKSVGRAWKQNQTMECNMTRKMKGRKKQKKDRITDVQEYLKRLPPPPEEHAYELKMEKRLKRMLKKKKNT
jgi:hypothetical protein